MKNILLCCILLLTLNSFAAKFYAAEIYYTDGKIKEGYASLPSNHSFSGNVSFKQSEEAEAEKMDDDQIQSIVYTADSGAQFYFEHTQCRFLYGKEGQRTLKQKDWILKTSSHELITTYSLSQSYYVNREAKMVALSTDSSGIWADVFVLFKKPGDTVPSVIMSFTSGAMIIGQEKKFRNAAKQFFTGEDKFIARIDAKEFKSENVHAMVTAYIAYKEGE